MSKEKYKNYSNKAEEVKEVADVVETFEEPEVEEVTDKIGEVTGCDKLRIRKDPNGEADVVCEIKAGTKVLIDDENSTDTFYKVCTEAGAEGYCMKDYISVND